MENTSESLLSNKKVKIGALSALAGTLLFTGTMALFSDRVSTDATATAGTVDLELASNWQDVANFNPGDMADLTYEISSQGNKSVDVREKLVIKSSQAMTADDQAEFEIYAKSDVTQDANGAYVPNQGAEPIATGADRIVSDDNTMITYVLDEYTLNGTGTAAEVEDGVDSTSKESEYVLVFNSDSSNAYQGANVTVDLLAEAKQHRNTGSDTWVEIATEDVTMGGEAVKAVPSK